VGSYNITVTVSDSRGAEAKDYLTITVNNPPTITSLIADPSWTTPSGTLQMTCTASDADHDVLTYEWTADGGDISGNGVAVNWTAPGATGTYNVTVVVRDSYGSEATGKLSLSVNLGIPPTVESLTVTAAESRKNPYLLPDGVEPGAIMRFTRQSNTILNALLQARAASWFTTGHVQAARSPEKAPLLPGLPQVHPGRSP